MKYAFIDRHRRSYEVKALCDAVQVSRSGYYAACGRAPSERQERQAVLTARILAIHTASRETYGAPRVHAELSAQDVPCCRNTVAKLMRRASILPMAIRRIRVTTDSRKTSCPHSTTAAQSGRSIALRRELRVRHPTKPVSQGRTNVTRASTGTQVARHF